MTLTLKERDYLIAICDSLYFGSPVHVQHGGVPAPAFGAARAPQRAVRVQTARQPRAKYLGRGDRVPEQVAFCEIIYYRWYIYILKITMTELSLYTSAIIFWLALNILLLIMALGFTAEI